MHLPATTTSIMLRNHPKLTDLKLVVEGYTNIDQLWLENMTGIDELAMLQRVPASTAVRITGFYWEAADAAEIETIFTLFDTMRGIDIDGHGQPEEVEKAQLSGTIHTSALTGDQIAAWKQRYPTVTVAADHTASTLTVKTWDGSSTIKTILCSDGVPTESIPTPPSRTSTAQYSYTAVGYSLNMDSQTNDPGCVTNVSEDRTVYAAYSRTVRQYTITWKNKDNTTLRTDTLNYGATPSWGQAMPTYDGQTAQGWTPSITTVTGNATYTASYIPTYTATFVLAAVDGGTTLYTQNNVPQGTTPTYGGSTPVSSRGNDYTFTGWSPALSGIQANTTYTAVFQAPQTWFDEEITDSWDTIISKITAGTATYKPGNYKPLDLGAQGIVNMQIVAENADALAAGGGTARYSWISKELLKDTHTWNANSRQTDPNDSSKYVEGTGTIGGWEKCGLRTYLRETIKPLIPANVRNAIKEVTKYSTIYNTSSSMVNNVTSTEDVWIPSVREVGWTYCETSGPAYSSAFSDNASRVKNNVSSGSAAVWWLRSAYSYSNANTVTSDGSYSTNGVATSRGVALGFCL